MESIPLEIGKKLRLAYCNDPIPTQQNIVVKGHINHLNLDRDGILYQLDL